MLEKQLVIIGGGPSGLQAAKMAAESGAKVLIIDRNPKFGGQLIKQTHRFFGSQKQYAKTRGIDIAQLLIKSIENNPLIEVMANATVLGLYSDKVLTVLKDDKYIKIKAEAMIIATGASEKFLAFENNDLPGIYGAEAVQTLMNVYGVKPGSRLLMVGSGNIGLIVSYQLMQAGVEVALVIDAAPKIGGYKVHAAKLRRLGVAIKTSYTIKKALGFDRVEGAQIIQLDENWNEIIGTEEEIMVDGICIAVGLSPLGSLAAMVGVQMVYIPELGGLVPKRKSGFQTSIPWIYVCGDASGIEEASSAMVEGSLAGLEAASFLGYRHREYQELETSFIEELNALRSGPYGNKYRQGLKKMEETDD